MQTTRKFGGLIAVNLVLLALLALVTLAPATNADSNNADSAAGDYIMVGGQVSGSTSNSMYVLDQRSGILVALKFELGTKKMKALSIRNLNQDAAKSGPGR